MNRFLFSLMFGAIWCDASSAELKVAGIFGDHMVVQRNVPVKVWGWAGVGDEVAVEFSGQMLGTKGAEDGSWEVTLTPLELSQMGQDLSVRTQDETVVVRDVLVGDVWHASGQSNMGMTVGATAVRLAQAKNDIKAARFPTVRFRRVGEGGTVEPAKDLSQRATWVTCSPETVSSFSAAAFYFARSLHEELKSVPIGIIDTSRGGTPIEPFIPREAFRGHPTLERELELGDKNDLEGIWRLPGGVRARDGNWLPGRLFHSRLAPIARFATKGVVWYQGESNCGDREDPRDYEHKMRALVHGWRKEMGNDALPFYFIQLPGSSARGGWPYLREQQRLCTDLPHSGMVVTIDLLDTDIHPRNKIDVGRRLARWALANEYGKSIVPSGPLFKDAKIDGSEVTVGFLYAESGLMVAEKESLEEPRPSPEAALEHFELADLSGRWEPAKAVIRGSQVIVSSAKMRSPTAVRYAYAIDPQHCRLYNKVGLPAAPFCSHPERLEFDPQLPDG